MRIDIGAHVGHWPFRRLPATTCAALGAQMDEVGIDLALISNLHALFYANCQAANEELAEWIAADRRLRDRWLPWAVLNPAYPGWQPDLASCRDRLGMRGIRLYPQYHGYTLADPRLRTLLLAVRDAGLPVAFTLRMIDARGRTPLDSPAVQADTEQLLLAEIAAVLPGVSGLRVVVLQTHFQALPAAAEVPLQTAEVLFDTSRASGCGVVGPNSYDLPKAMAKFGQAKFAFGSMSPFTDPVSPVLRLEAAGLAAGLENSLWHENARRFFRL